MPKAAPRNLSRDRDQNSPALSPTNGNRNWSRSSRNGSEIECWLTDMDGVLVHENQAVPGAAELIQRWVDTTCSTS
ncbi:hypothetical protein NCCP2145_12980 [Pseudarthrobacter sp. NCCP-2145]|nr:hypothetical protein NCCP2145_12980 [Pseudarthrobacter sp. NCCP-2145]